MAFVIILILQMKRPRFTQAKFLTQGHTFKYVVRILTWALSDLRLLGLTITLY